jgi:hypothetical protein
MYKGKVTSSAIEGLHIRERVEVTPQVRAPSRFRVSRHYTPHVELGAQISGF